MRVVATLGAFFFGLTAHVYAQYGQSQLNLIASKWQFGAFKCSAEVVTTGGLPFTGTSGANRYWGKLFYKCPDRAVSPSEDVSFYVDEKRHFHLDGTMVWNATDWEVDHIDGVLSEDGQSISGTIGDKKTREQVLLNRKQ